MNYYVNKNRVIMYCIKHTATQTATHEHTNTHTHTHTHTRSTLRHNSWRDVHCR